MTPLSAYDIDVGSLTLFGEASNQGEDGEIAVAWVVRNRMRDTRWPNTVAEVCLQRSQFSCWIAADWNTANLLRMLTAYLGKTQDFLQARSIAQWVFGGFTSLDPTHGANHYHTRDVVPTWRDPSKVTYEYRQHIFYKL
jgi:spore germination cell wall hydrolase CwlJ-like protein